PDLSRSRPPGCARPPPGPTPPVSPRVGRVVPLPGPARPPRRPAADAPAVGRLNPPPEPGRRPTRLEFRPPRSRGERSVCPLWPGQMRLENKLLPSATMQSVDLSHSARYVAENLC